jgi:hypothetical protein
VCQEFEVRLNVLSLSNTCDASFLSLLEDLMSPTLSKACKY